MGHRIKKRINKTIKMNVTTKFTAFVFTDLRNCENMMRVKAEFLNIFGVVTKHQHSQSKNKTQDDVKYLKKRKSIRCMLKTSQKMELFFVQEKKTLKAASMLKTNKKQNVEKTYSMVYLN